MIGEIQTAIKVFGWGVRGYFEEEKEAREALPELIPSLSCDTGKARWSAGANFYRLVNAYRRGWL